MRSVRRLAPLALLVTLGGCGSGRLVISLDPPKIEALDPLKDGRLSKFGLRVTHNGSATDQDAFRGKESELTVGNVPTDSGFDLRLAGKTAADDLLGLGMVLDVQASATGETEVAVKFRKPIAYVAGLNHVLVFDTSAVSEETFELPHVQLAGVTDVAATPTGVLVLAVAGTSLVPFRTEDHNPAALAPVPLPAVGTCVAVNPDSRFAVVCHRAAKSVSIVPLDLIGGKVTVLTKSVGGEPTKVAFGGERGVAWVLVDGFGPQGSCGAPATSQIVRLDLTTGETAQSILDRHVSDVAVDPRDGAVLLTMPCEAGGAIARFVLNKPAEVLTTTPIPSPYDMAVVDQGIIVLGGVLGGTSSKQARIQATTFDLTKSGFRTAQTRSFALPPLNVDFRRKGVVWGMLTWVSEATGAKVFDVAVSPDGRRAVALFQATYSSNMDFGGCVFRSQIIGTGYLVVDLATTTLLAQRYAKLEFSDCAASCLVDESSQSMNIRAVCDAEFRRALQDAGLLFKPEFEATASALLFGST